MTETGNIRPPNNSSPSNGEVIDLLSDGEDSSNDQNEIKESYNLRGPMIVLDDITSHIPHQSKCHTVSNVNNGVLENTNIADNRSCCDLAVVGKDEGGGASSSDCKQASLPGVAKVIEIPYSKKRCHRGESIQESHNLKPAGSSNAGVAKCEDAPGLSQQSLATNTYGKPILKNPYKKNRRETETLHYVYTDTSKSKGPPSTKSKPTNSSQPKKELQAGLVFEEDIFDPPHDAGFYAKTSDGCKPFVIGKKMNSKKSIDDMLDRLSEDQQFTASRMPSSAQAYAQHQYTTRINHHLPPILYHDPLFVAGNPATIDGINKFMTKKNPKNHGLPINRPNDANIKSNKVNPIFVNFPKCRCRPPKPCTLSYYSKEGQNHGRPFHRCQDQSIRGCNFFSWAFNSHMLHWYRFGNHSGHVMVQSKRGYQAEDLLQGKVGDCWFLSALAVVAEREDLISRLIGPTTAQDARNIGTYMTPTGEIGNNFGVVELTLFVDGFWKKIITDDFLPCIISQEKEDREEINVRLALEKSLLDESLGVTSSQSSLISNVNKRSSKFDPHTISDECRSTLLEINEFLHHDRFNKDPKYRSNSNFSKISNSIQALSRTISTSDLAYSKAKYNQLWVPFLEKGYAIIHGSYQAISGGHVAEAFLDLTGAPTAVYNFDHHDFNPRAFWSDLMSYRQKRLPMGCGTTTSAAGIIGMHAYSILDVREVKNVGFDFFEDKMVRGTLGNVSGFTDFDGTVRLLRIRNPHGQGEWKGEFSDRSPVWERLLAHKLDSFRNTVGVDLMCDLTKPQSPDLERTMVNDGTFWIGYDDFLMGFSNVDVVLAFKGNHAKSFNSYFPEKQSCHRCSRAFELSVVDRQPGEESSVDEKVEVYIMGIQKTRRGAYHGRADRKKSYKACDLGILVGEYIGTGDNVDFNAVDGRFFGMTRNSHLRIVMDRTKPNTKMVIMPLSFGHPSATDDERSFVLRFVSDSPLLVRELADTPQMNLALHKFCFGNRVMSLSIAGTSRHRGLQCSRKVLLDYMHNDTPLFRIFQIDFLAGDGGTVLLYLCVDDKCFSELDSSLKKTLISFSVEVNCRGMICRTAHGLAEHRVVSKGKKFEAAWRRFSLAFKSETKSRLLSAVVQSGQDYQMGSIKCSLLSSDQGAPCTKEVLLSKFFSPRCMKFGSVENEVLRSPFENYEEFGLFTSVSAQGKSLSNHKLVPTESVFNVHHPTHLDHSLEMALQRSKEEFDMQVAIDRCNGGFNNRKEPVEILDSPGNDDSDLEAAIIESISEHRCDMPQESIGGPTDSFAEDLEKAIKLSMKMP